MFDRKKYVIYGVLLILLGIGCFFNQYALNHTSSSNIVGGFIGIILGILFLKNRTPKP